MAFWWVLQRGYKGIITIDGNDKDSVDDVPAFVAKLEEGFDFVQGSRYMPGGKAINTPLIRDLSVRLIHAPIISLAARFHFSDTTNAFRGYSRKYLEHPEVQPFRDIFMTYEILAYLSVRASQLGLNVCEIPVTRAYPEGTPPPTKISFLRGNLLLMKILLRNLCGYYNP
jgi:dolichol-phosphate mannosyltransferase